MAPSLRDLTWVSRAYVIDWAVVVTLWTLSYIASKTPVFEREFSPEGDLLISHPHKSSQITGNVNNMISLILPTIIVGVVGGYRASLLEIHHGIISVSAGRGLSRLITEFLKSRVGRLRPDFLATCKWDKALEACTGKSKDILDGRRSFPSGHSSSAFAGMAFLSLWIAGQTAALCFNVPLAPASLKSSRLARLVLSMLPLFWATYVAITRLEDNRHHKEDVIAGSIVGIFSATVCYLTFWPSPFSSENFIKRRTGAPRLLYIEEDRMSRNADFELARLEEELETV